ncbi:hypothetical protein GPECTOR_52g7 [Gonium pectorale]|uniref:Uncharacterized protein n=1 Tax=Gonium pectorale TaxID=33097 RepID=A0A150G748_GONPE|nr:hypothetical protein GPECTOR_52g7 [Gonium pectorale]|eukprot:KXZ45672.1 hypothetical protein GPECTOR_52g7 [Gonium pectorale]
MDEDALTARFTQIVESRMSQLQLSLSRDHQELQVALTRDHQEMMDLLMRVCKRLSKVEVELDQLADDLVGGAAAVPQQAASADEERECECEHERRQG